MFSHPHYRGGGAKSAPLACLEISTCLPLLSKVGVIDVQRSEGRRLSSQEDNKQGAWAKAGLVGQLTSSGLGAGPGN